MARMRRALLRLAACITLIVGLAPIMGASRAEASVAVYGATGVLDLAYIMEGTLPTFPCDDCSTTFSGDAQGAGHLHAYANDEVWDVSLAADTLLGNQTGSVDYQEPGGPYCPAIGQASGTITLTDSSAKGTVTRTGAPTDVGSVYAVTLTVGFTYQRVGVSVVITVTSASIRADFASPKITGSVTAASTGLVGAGSGVFVVQDPQLVASRCASPGPLPFSLVGTGSIAVVGPQQTGGEYKDEGALYAIGTGGQGEGGRIVCATTGGWTQDCTVALTTTGASIGNFVGVTGTGSSGDNTIGVTGTGPSSGNDAGVTGTGPSTGNIAGVSGAGASSGNDVSVSGTNRADGGCNAVCFGAGENAASISGMGPAGTGLCPGSVVAISGTGDACGDTVAISGTGTATGQVAVSGAGDANGSAYEVSGKEEVCVTTGLMC